MHATPLRIQLIGDELQCRASFLWKGARLAGSCLRQLRFAANQIDS
jgi:hypothetical protein